MTADRLHSFLLNPYRSDSLRRDIASLPCSACGSTNQIEVINNAWSDTHAFPLCVSCRHDYDLDVHKRREFENEQNQKTLRRIVELYDGRLTAPEGE